MKVYFSRLAESKLNRLIEYLEQEWGTKAKRDFLAELDKRINQIILQPDSCPRSQELGGFYKCVITKQTTFFYRVKIDKKEIEIITLFDTRQDPAKLKDELK